jgi:MFS family permease
MVLLGTGAGLAFPALMTLAMSGATPSDSGLASGFVNTTVQVGGAIGLAVLATLATERTDALRAQGEVAASALNAGYHLAYLIGATLVAAAIVVAVVVVRTEDREAAARAEEGGHAGRPAYSEAG